MEVDIDPEMEVNPPAQRELGGKLAGLSLSKQVWVLAMWPMLEMLMAFLVGTVDLMLAGRLDPQPLAMAATDALGAAGYITWLVAMIFQAVGVGSAALIARAIGGRHRRLANAALGQALLLAAVSGVLITALLWIAAPWVGQSVGRGQQAIDLCTTYLRIVALAGPANAVLLIGASALRGAGDTRTPFRLMIAVNLVNVIASVGLVWAGYDVRGIAIGTALAWWSGAILIMVDLVGVSEARGGMRLRLFRLRPHAHTLKRIVRVGLPNLFEGVVGMWIGNYLVLMIVGKLAIDGIIGTHMIIIRFESMSFLIGAAIGTAAATLAGQYLGLGDPARARQAIKLAWIYASVLMSAIGILFYAIPRQLAMLITDVEQMIDMAVTPIRIVAPIQAFFATQMVLSGALRGAGDTRATMIITTAMVLFVRVPAVWWVAVKMDAGFNAIWLVLAIELSLRAVLFAARFLHGGWMRVKV